MANTYYSLTLAQSALGEIKNALIDKYGAGNVTVHYENYSSTSYLIFSCSAISDKVIKISASTDPKFTWYYGDAWTSGSTITNQVQFSSSPGTTATKEFHLALGDNFLLLVEKLSSTAKSRLELLGRLSNNKYILGSYGYSATSNLLCRNTTDNVDVSLVTFSRGFLSPDGKMYKQPLIFARANGVEVDAGDNLATINGLYNISHAPGLDTIIATEDYLMSTTGLRLADDITYIQTALFVEFGED